MPIPRLGETSKPTTVEAVERADPQSPSVSFGLRYASVGPLPIGSDATSLEFVREVQAITCVSRSVISVQERRVFIHFECLDDAATFLETWIFLIEQSAKEDGAEADAPIHLQVVPGLSRSTLLALKQYLAIFGRGGYLVVDDEQGVSFVFNDPADAALMRQQFGRAFQGSDLRHTALS